MYISPLKFPLYKACTDSIHQITAIPSLYYTFRDQTAKKNPGVGISSTNIRHMSIIM